MVSPAAEREHLAASARIQVERGLDLLSLYHLDLPFTVHHQLDLLNQAGFAEVDVSYREENQAVFVAKA